MKGVLYLIIFYSGFCFSQDVINIQGFACDIHGSSKPGSKTFYLNGLKNRYSFPDEKDFDTSIHIQDLIHSPDPNQFSVNKAIHLSGYVFNVKPGGVETCNCRSK